MYTRIAMQLSLSVVALAPLAAGVEAPTTIAPVEQPVAFDRPQLTAKLLESTRYIRADEARRDFSVSGDGTCVAVLDTGLRASHEDFAGRVPVQANFTTDNGAQLDDASDGNGHGTNVAGIIAANGIHTGIAPNASIIPVKVLRNDGGGSFQWVEQALQWVLDHHQEHRITAVSMSLGDSGNFLSDQFDNDGIRDRIIKLRALRVPVMIAAGNDFYRHGSIEGMGYPGIIRECLSVGAVYDADEGPFQYADGATAFTSGSGRLTPFSQRLHESTAPETRTDVFAPGAPVTSSGHTSDRGESIQHGTSQATPVTAGVVLLLQEYYQRLAGELPEVDEIERWIRQGAKTITDGDDEDDNVTNTGKEFAVLDAYDTLDAVRRSARLDLFESSESSKFFHP